MHADHTVAGLVGRYLADLSGLPASSASAHRWALGGLRDAWGDEPLAVVLGEGGIVRWLTAPTGSGREPAPATVRQRAAAVRALLRFGAARGLVDEATIAAAHEALRRPATPPVLRVAGPAALLLERAGGRRPHGVSWHVWVRFRAHVAVLAETGATERDLARARVDDLGPGRVTLTLGGASYALRDSARHAIGDWLPVRAGLVATLQGSPPPQLWVRVHPSVHPRTGAVAAVGMPITARGLRKAFSDVVAALEPGEPRLAGCTVAHLRALGPPGLTGPSAERPDGAS